MAGLTGYKIDGAVAEGDPAIVVAVDRRGEVVPPCDTCRVLISDHAANAKVVIKAARHDKIVVIAQRLPTKYKRI